jgi:GntR family transcriptional repressor for pyruvate dehydrogenase complex
MIRRETLTSRVFDYLVEEIKSGKVKPGEKLPTEKALTQTLGVSRTCVREAMKSLQALQLVTVRAAVGAIVNEPTPAAWFNAEAFAAAIHSEQRDAQMEFRHILEVGLVSLAAVKADHMDFLAMSKSISAYESAIAKGEPPFQADVDFHTAVAVASKNPIAEMVWRSIVKPVTDQLRATNSLPHGPAEGLRDHLRIFSAVTEHNPEKARSAMRAHLEGAERNWLVAKSAIPAQANPVHPGNKETRET